MTQQDADNLRAQEISARRDLEDIRTLQRTEAFDRYFMRRVRDRFAQAVEAYNTRPSSLIYHAPDTKEKPCTPEEREILRAQCVVLRELIDLVDEGEKQILGELSRLSGSQFSPSGPS